MEIKRPEPKYKIPADAKKVFTGIIYDVYQWQQEQFDGSFKTFEVLKRDDTADVFPVLPDGKILLAEQMQPGWRKPIHSGFGGHIDPGEGVIEAISRELLEEAGCTAKEYILWTSMQTNTKMDRAVYIFVAKGIEEVKPIEKDGGEHLKLIRVTFDEFLDIVLEKDFYESEITRDVYEAKLHPEKMAALREMFKP